MRKNSIILEMSLKSGLFLILEVEEDFLSQKTSSSITEVIDERSSFKGEFEETYFFFQKKVLIPIGPRKCYSFP